MTLISNNVCFNCENLTDTISCSKHNLNVNLDNYCDDHNYKNNYYYDYGHYTVTTTSISIFAALSSTPHPVTAVRRPGMSSHDPLSAQRFIMNASPDSVITPAPGTALPSGPQLPARHALVLRPFGKGTKQLCDAQLVAPFSNSFCFDRTVFVK